LRMRSSVASIPVAQRGGAGEPLLWHDGTHSRFCADTQRAMLHLTRQSEEL
jgi:hypothetical protein